MNDTYTFDLFLSHNNRDKDRVIALAQRLRNAGLKVWLDAWEIQPGDHIFLKVEEGLTLSRALVLFMTENAFDSDWVKMERGTVLFRDPVNRDRRFLPVLAADCEIPDSIKGYAYIDYRRESDEALQKLIKACKKEEVEKEATEPKPIALLERKLKGHTDWVLSIVVSPDSRWAISGSHDKTVKLWNLETGACVGTFEGHQSDILSVAVSPGGSWVASTGFTDNTVRIWDLKTGNYVQVIKDDEGGFEPVSVAFSPDGKRLMVGNSVSGDDYSLYIYHLSDEESASPTEPGQRYSNAKVVLVGESGVGKSGLALRLIEDKFIKTYSTHGMRVWRLDLPIPAEGRIEREVLLWDLAGQEDYRLIHQLFLDETALALMLFNPQKEDPFVEVSEWVKVMQVVSCKMTKGRQLAKLLIAARTDVGHIKISQKKIDRFLTEHDFAAYLATSAKKGENCSDRKVKHFSALKELIARHIPWDTLPWSSTPKLLRELKNALLEMTEEKVNLLRFPELTQRLKQKLPDKTFVDQTVRTAVTLLNPMKNYWFGPWSGSS